MKSGYIIIGNLDSTYNRNELHRVIEVKRNLLFKVYSDVYSQSEKGACSISTLLIGKFPAG